MPRPTPQDCLGGIDLKRVTALIGVAGLLEALAT
jgi:hypothetical protein